VETKLIDAVNNEKVFYNLTAKVFLLAGYILQDYQWDIIKCNARRTIINKARGIGATLAIAYRILIHALTKKKEYIVISHDKEGAMHVLSYVDEFYTALFDVLEEYNIDPGCKMLGEGAKNEKRFSNDALIKSFSSKPKAVRGFHGDVYWDEAAYHADDKKLRKAINGCLRPNHNFMVFSTPGEQSGEFFELWNAKGKEGKEWLRFELPFEVCNIPEYQESVKKERKEAEERGLLEEWAQEYKCKFIDGSQRMFNWIFINKCVEKDVPFVPVEYYGSDFGKKVDHSEMVGVGKDTTGVIHVPQLIEYLLGQKYSIQLESMISTVKNNNDLLKWYLDATGVGVKISEDVENSDVSYLAEPIVFTNQIKESMIMFLYTAMHTEKIKLPNDKKLLQQLYSIKREVTDGGGIRYKHEDGKHDDRVWALVLALRGYARNGESMNNAKIETSGKMKYNTTLDKLAELRQAIKGAL
jgi:phage FluMu gp28-like protein